MLSTAASNAPRRDNGNGAGAAAFAPVAGASAATLTAGVRSPQSTNTSQQLISPIARLTTSYRSLMLSFTDFSSGLSRYSMMRRWLVLISTVTAIPGDSLTCFPSTWMVARSMLTRVG